MTPAPMESLERSILNACLWEARARKAGNVHPGASFADLTCADFERSAHAAAPELARAPELPLGEVILAAVRATRRVVQTNTNLGIILLLAPLARAASGTDPRAAIAEGLAETTVEDSIHTYQAIRLAMPGGLGEVPDQDVADTPTITLRETMALAADRDLIARQYARDFVDVWDLGLPALREGVERFHHLEPAIQHCQLCWLGHHRDSLIVRKRGPEIAEAASEQARKVLDLGSVGTIAGRQAYAELDAWLRGDGHARNPGTTADLVAACLFLAIRERSISAETPFSFQGADSGHESTPHT